VANGCRVERGRVIDPRLPQNVLAAFQVIEYLRAFVASRTAKGIAINCDTIDNSGNFICMSDDVRRRDAIAVSKAGKTVGEIIKVRHTIRGILTDSIALRRGGWDSCTLSRGNLGTLARVHTPRDEPGRIDGAGVARAARILAATIEELS